MLQNQKSQLLLSKKERVVCEDLAAMEIVLISQRAQALLLLDEGLTHAEAAHETGLSIGQVRYALRTFKSKGLALFPDASPPEIDATVSENQDTAEKKAKGKKAKKAKENKSLPIKKKKQKKKGKTDGKKAEKKLKKSKKKKKGKKGKKNTKNK